MTGRSKTAAPGVNQKGVRRYGTMGRDTTAGVGGRSEPPGYRLECPRAKPKLGPYLGRIEQILTDDQAMPAKQRHTAKRIWERLREAGYTGGYTAVKEAVHGLRRTGQEVFVPLGHRPGEAQVDFGQAVVKVNGRLRKVAFFVMALPYSDAVFVQAFERECMETFREEHVQALAFFGGVPRRISYDNTTIAVSQILGGGRGRRLTRGFCQLKSHYLFDQHFCRPARGNKKGVVEGR